MSFPISCVLILISLPPQADDEYMLSDYDLFVNQFISVPKDMGQLNCAAFIAGILKGALHGAGFPARHLTSLAQSFAARITRHPRCNFGFRCRVTAHFVAIKGQARAKTTFLMKFDASVLQREHRLPQS